MIADGVAGRRSAGAGTKPGETAAADTAAAKEPVPGEGGGQVGEEIVVTGSRNRGSEAARLQRIAAFEAALQARQAAEQRDADGDASTSIDRGNHPYPVQPEEMGGLTEWQLRAKRAAYMGAVEASGESYTDHELNVKAFDDLIAQTHVREAPAAAQADAAANEIVYYGIGLPAQLAAEAVTGELLIGVAVKGYRTWNVARAAKAASFGPPRLGLRIPQGVGARTFDVVSARVRAAVGKLGLGDDIFVMGSRSGGTAKPGADFDFGVRVSPDKFDDLISRSFGNPNPGSALARTRDIAIRDGRIQTGEAGLRGVRATIARTLNVPQSKVQISVIRGGGVFDNGPQTPLAFGF